MLEIDWLIVASGPVALRLQSRFRGRAAFDMMGMYSLRRISFHEPLD